MLYILLGMAGFIILFCFDISSLKEKPVLKQAAWITGNILIVFSILMVCLRTERIALPDFYRFIGWGISPVFFLILSYSLFIEIPLKKTYLNNGAGETLVTTGTYGLVRHPGVLWYFFSLTGLFLITGSKTLLFAMPVWCIMDIVYVVLQERFIFLRQFGDDYNDYKKKVPMLIPNSTSVKRYFSTLLNG